MTTTLTVDANVVARVKALLEKHWAKRQWMYDRTEKFTSEEVEDFLKGESNKYRAADAEAAARDFRHVSRPYQFYSVVSTLTRTMREDGTPAECELHACVLADQIYFMQKSIGLVA